MDQAMLDSSAGLRQLFQFFELRHFSSLLIRSDMKSEKFHLFGFCIAQSVEARTEP